MVPPSPGPTATRPTSPFLAPAPATGPGPGPVATHCSALDAGLCAGAAPGAAPSRLLAPDSSDASNFTVAAADPGKQPLRPVSPSPAPSVGTLTVCITPHNRVRRGPRWPSRPCPFRVEACAAVRLLPAGPFKHAVAVVPPARSCLSADLAAPRAWSAVSRRTPRRRGRRSSTRNGSRRFFFPVRRARAGLLWAPSGCCGRVAVSACHAVIGGGRMTPL